MRKNTINISRMQYNLIIANEKIMKNKVSIKNKYIALKLESITEESVVVFYKNRHNANYSVAFQGKNPEFLKTKVLDILFPHQEESDRNNVIDTSVKDAIDNQAVIDNVIEKIKETIPEMKLDQESKNETITTVDPISNVVPKIKLNDVKKDDDFLTKSTNATNNKTITKKIFKKGTKIQNKESETKTQIKQIEKSIYLNFNNDSTDYKQLKNFINEVAEPHLTFVFGNDLGDTDDKLEIMSKCEYGIFDISYLDAPNNVLNLYYAGYMIGNKKKVLLVADVIYKNKINPEITKKTNIVFYQNTDKLQVAINKYLRRHRLISKAK